jgi:putative endonuclease
MGDAVAAADAVAGTLATRSLPAGTPGVSDRRGTTASMSSTVERGSAAEARAVQLLVRKGYRIVERNFRCGSSELDVIARDGDVLVFVEVRSRADDAHGHAAETVDRRKQRQVAKVAMHYIGLRDPVFVKSRFDVVAITGDEELLIQDAFRP